jgi:hypothetical protein
MRVTNLRSEVLSELKEMKRVGIKVPAAAFDLLVQEDLEDYDNMSTSEIADLLIELAGAYR